MEIIPENICAPAGGYSFFHVNLKLSDSCLCITEKIFPNFQKQLVDLWIRIKYKEPSNITEISNQAIWNNLFIEPQPSEPNSSDHVTITQKILASII